MHSRICRDVDVCMLEVGGKKKKRPRKTPLRVKSDSEARFFFARAGWKSGRSQEAKTEHRCLQVNGNKTERPELE